MKRIYFSIVVVSFTPTQMFTFAARLYTDERVLLGGTTRCGQRSTWLSSSLISSLHVNVLETSTTRLSLYKDFRFCKNTMNYY